MPKPDKSFLAAFNLAEAVERAVSYAAGGARTIRPDIVARRIIQDYPELDVAPAELAAAVVEAATRSGLGLQVLLPGK